MAPLNHKQKRFALEYRVDGNATQAALRAGYSPATAHSQGHRLLKNAEVRRLIDAHTEKVLAQVEARGDRVLKELAHFAHSDLLDAFNDDGTLKHPKDMPEGIRRAIKSIEFTELFEGASGEKFVTGRIVKLTLWPKDRGLELLGKHEKLFTDRVEHEVSDSLAELLAKARQAEGEE